jgi:hypothetical protein
VDEKLILLRNGNGKVDADPVRKLSYFIFTADPSDKNSPTLLIPMATSRFDRYNYQTDDWWNAHKAEIDQAKYQHTPMPHQDPVEVMAFLQKNGLSTNPDVFLLHANSGQVSKQQLRDFLLNEYLTRYTEDGSVVLYRGAERADELAAWQRKEFPHGVRYWTGDANYGWRYGRKNSNLLSKTMDGEAPVFRFKVPKNDFVRMVNSGDLVLGTELTKSAHRNFPENYRFTDDLAGGADYLGEGKYGLEFEIRGTRRVREQFVNYFDGPLNVEDLANARRQQINVGIARILRQTPARATELEQMKASRLATVNAEEQAMVAIRDGHPAEEITALLGKLTGQEEITAVFDENLQSLGKTYKPKNPPTGIAAAALPAAPPCSVMFGKAIP